MTPVPYAEIEACVLGERRCFYCKCALYVPEDPDEFWAICTGCSTRWQVRDGTISAIPAGQRK